MSGDIVISTEVFKDQARIEYGVASYNPSTHVHEIVYRHQDRREAERVLRQYQAHAARNKPILVQRSVFETAFRSADNDE